MNTTHDVFVISRWSTASGGMDKSRNDIPILVASSHYFG